MAKGGANGYAALVKQRSEGKTKRRRLDDYETPDDKTGHLLDNWKPKSKRIHEPAAGSGRMARVMRARGYTVTTADIKHGQDFLARTAIIKGNTATNPPYRDGLADAVVTKALRLTDGEVAMLMEAKYLFGDKRNQTLYQVSKPCKIIVIPERIYFFEGSGANAKQIESQFFNHVWIIWPDRAKRDKGGYPCEVVWAKPSFG